MSHTPLIRVESLTKKFNAGRQNCVVAVNDVSFEVDKGEILAIIGPNGSGKSTLMKLLSGVLRPTSGQIERWGTLASILSIGGGFHPDLTGRENIVLIAQMYGLSKKEIALIADDIIEYSGIGQFINEPLKTFSDGMFLRLAFSTYLKLKSDIILLDEVLSAGDQEFQKKLVQTFHDKKRNNETMIIVSHDLNSIKDLADTCIHMDHGRIVQQGSTAALVGNYILGVTKSAKNITDTERYAEEISHSPLKVQEIHKDEDFMISELELSADTACFETRSIMSIKISMEVFKADLDLTFLLFIKSLDGKVVHMDSIFIREHNTASPLSAIGSYIAGCEAPPYLLNSGVYTLGISCMKGNSLEPVFLDDLLFFSVRFSSWEENKIWNKFESYTRIPLSWHINMNT